jgi:hypothetical protein
VSFTEYIDDACLYIYLHRSLPMQILHSYPVSAGLLEKRPSFPHFFSDAGYGTFHCFHVSYGLKTGGVL